MRFKIILVLVFCILFNSSFVYCDTVYNKTSRSGTVAISGAVASSLLALATKLGVEFATGDEMDKFVKDVISTVSGVDIVQGISDTLVKVGTGVVGIPASIVNSLCSYINSQKLSETSVTYYKFTDGGQTYSIPILPYSFDSKTKYGDSGWAYFKRVAELSDNSTSVTFRDNGIYSEKVFQFSNMALGFRNDGYELWFSSGSAGDTFDDGLTGYTIKWDSSYTRVKCFLFGEAKSDGSDYEILLGYVFYNPLLGIQYGEAGTKSLGYSRYWRKHIVDDGMTNGGLSLPTGLVSSPGKTDIAIPSNPNELIGLNSDEITTTPSYDIWTPGTTITPPSSSAPSLDYTNDLYVPEVPIVDTDIPSTDTDTPSTDTDTPSTTWDWLKALLQSILDLIKSISDWLTNFWDKLLEFIVSIFVPSDSYFTDKFSEIMSSLEQKLPNIDISKLKDLAVGEYKFEDVYATFFGIECLVVKGSIINNVVGWAKPIIQGLIGLFLLLYNYNQIYKLIRGGSLVGSSNIISERLGKR